MNVQVQLDDWRLLERIVGLTSRLGCRYTALNVSSHANTYHASIDFDGPADALRRLDLQLARLLADDKEMSR
jgi:acetolactate synthase regulatory subunit